jgi:hypothetical protein
LKSLYISPDESYCIFIRSKDRRGGFVYAEYVLIDPKEFDIKRLFKNEPGNMAYRGYWIDEVNYVYLTYNESINLNKVRGVSVYNAKTDLNMVLVEKNYYSMGSKLIFINLDLK